MEEGYFRLIKILKLGILLLFDVLSKKYKMKRKITLNGKSYNIPLNSELYLIQLYGNWKIPSKKHAITKYHRGNGLVNSEYSKYWDKDFEIFKCNM